MCESGFHTDSPALSLAAIAVFGLYSTFSVHTQPSVFCSHSDLIRGNRTQDNHNREQQGPAQGDDDKVGLSERDKIRM